MVKPLLEFLKDMPDHRSSRKKLHELAEVLMLIIIGFLAGKHTFRRMRRWLKKKEKVLKKHLKLEGGIPSIATMSRIASSVDPDLVALAFVDWIGQIVSTKGIHIVIDGKGLRAATEKIRGGRTPYILNAIDAATKLVIAQLAISEKTNEMTAIPEMIRILDISGSTVTIDAIGATSEILNLIDEQNGYFVQQVKKNCPATYQEIKNFFETTKKEKDEDKEDFEKKNNGKYDEYDSGLEINRDRHEYRAMLSYSGDSSVSAIRDDIPSIRTIGMSTQVRIPIERDDDGNDATPSKNDFMKNGSRRRPHPTDGDALTDDVERVAMVSNRDCKAKELAQYKREHWRIENCLHYVLDESFREDKCTARKSKKVLSVLRKFAYNVIRLIQISDLSENIPVTHVMDDIETDLGIASKYLFKPLPSLY